MNNAEKQKEVEDRIASIISAAEANRSAYEAKRAQYLKEIGQLKNDLLSLKLARTEGYSHE